MSHTNQRPAATSDDTLQGIVVVAFAALAMGVLIGLLATWIVTV